MRILYCVAVRMVPTPGSRHDVSVRCMEMIIQGNIMIVQGKSTKIQEKFTFQKFHKFHISQQLLQIARRKWYQSVHRGLLYRFIYRIHARMDIPS